MRVRLWVGSVAIAAMAIVTTSNSATAAPWKPTKTTARQLAHDGASDFKRGDYEHAAEKLEAAWSVEPAGNISFALAQAHRKLGHWQRALELYEIVLKDTDTPSQYRELAAAARDVVRGFQLAESLATSGEYADARRYYESVLRVADLPSDERDRAAHGLADVARRETEAKTPHSDTATDAHPTNTATSPTPTPTITQASAPPATNIVRTSRWRDPIGWSFAGVGVVAAGVGAYLLADASSLDDQANAESSATTREQLHATAHTRRTAGTVTAIGGGVFVILAVARFALIGPPSSSTSATSLQFIPGPGDVGLGLAFDF